MTSSTLTPWRLTRALSSVGELGSVVAVQQGQIVIMGSVPSHERRSSVRIAAENTFGVVSVDNRSNVMELVCIPGF